MSPPPTFCVFSIVAVGVAKLSYHGRRTDHVIRGGLGNRLPADVSNREVPSPEVRVQAWPEFALLMSCLPCQIARAAVPQDGGVGEVPSRNLLSNARIESVSERGLVYRRLPAHLDHPAHLSCREEPDLQVCNVQRGWPKVELVLAQLPSRRQGDGLHAEGGGNSRRDFEEVAVVPQSSVRLRLAHRMNDRNIPRLVRLSWQNDATVQN